jgi:hypothetical protein
MSRIVMAKKRTSALAHAAKSKPDSKFLMRVMFGCWCASCLWGGIELVGYLRAPQRSASATDASAPRPQPLSEYSRAAVPDGLNNLSSSHPESIGQDTMHASKWPHSRKDIPVPVKTHVFSSQGATQLVDETGHVNAAYTQESRQQMGLAELGSLQFAATNINGLSNEQPKHMDDYQRIVSDGYVASKPPNDSDHFASRRVMLEQSSAK